MVKRIPIERSILLTLLYSSIFHFPLLLDEIVDRQVRVSKKAFPKKQIAKQLLTMDGVFQYRGFYGLSSVLSIRDVIRRKKRNVWSEKKWQEVMKIKKLLSFIPTISEVYLTGSLAVKNISSPRDDIDLLIITRNSTLWLTRALVILITTFWGKYRLHDTGGRDSWCFNLWLELDSASLQKERRNIYSAYEILQAKQIVGRQNSLLRQNVWVGRYLFPQKSFLLDEQKSISMFGKVMFPLLSTINKMMYQIQRKYMSSRLTVETVNLNSAFFHPHNMSEIVQNRFNQLRRQHRV